MQKCQIFIAGLDVLAADSLCNVMQIPGGVLPVVSLSDLMVPSGRVVAQWIKDYLSLVPDYLTRTANHSLQIGADN